MRLSVSLIIVLAGAATLAAPGASQPRAPGGPGATGRGLFVSPAGEPFRRGEGMPQPMRAWFEQADADHDGALVWAEFEADFLRWYALLDADHDGEIEPEEVDRYEQQILPEMQSRVGGGLGPGMRIGGMGRGRDGVGGGGRGNGGSGRPARRGVGAGGMAMLSGAARFGLLPIAHPVMDADINFNRGVSRAEFSQAAARRFAMLNTLNNGRLTLAQLIETRRQGFDPGRRDLPGLGAPEDDEGAPPAEGD